MKKSQTKFNFSLSDICSFIGLFLVFIAGVIISICLFSKLSLLLAFLLFFLGWGLAFSFLALIWSLYE